MNGALPYLFFFSYSHTDWEYDVYLSKFFEDLEKTVAVVTGAGTRKVGFRDEEGVKTGDDWTSKISAAVQTSNVLVCVYTPNFFSRERTHEFCAKEFMAFLKRDPQHCYERVVDQEGHERYEVCEARNILPILWLSERVLVELNKLPPYAVHRIQYTLNFAYVPSALNDRYREKGMSLITTQRKGTYRQILTHLATRIVELAADPLPSIAPPPDLRTLRNAFYDPPEIVASDGAAPACSSGHMDTLDDSNGPRLGPKQLLAFEVRSPPSDASAWVPYPGKPNLRVLVEEIAQLRRGKSSYRTFDPSAGDFVTALLAVLIDATEERVLPILFVAPTTLARPAWRAAVVSLLHHPWRGGIVVPLDASDQPSIRLIESIRPEFEMTPNEREWVVVRVAQGGVAEFRTAVISVADEILARIVNHGSVERSAPATVGPSVRPRIANTLDSQRAQP
jgi:hypothetical protein